MDPELYEALINIGLTDGEAKTYLALVSLGTSTVGPVIELSGISASKVYIILNRLIQKGLITTTVEEKKKLYTASHPERIVEYLNDEQQKLERHKKNVEKIIPLLRLKKETASTKPIVEYTRGKKGFISLYEDTINESTSKDIFLVLCGRRITPAMQDYWYGMNLRLSKKGIKKFMTYEWDAWFDKTSPLARRPERTFYYPNYLPKEYADVPNIVTLGNNIIISDISDAGEVYALLIRNKNLATAFKRLLTALYGLGIYPKGYAKGDIEILRKSI